LPQDHLTTDATGISNKRSYEKSYNSQRKIILFCSCSGHPVPNYFTKSFSWKIRYQRTSPRYP